MKGILSIVYSRNR